MRSASLVASLLLLVLVAQEPAYCAEQRTFDRNEYLLGPLYEGGIREYRIPLKNTSGHSLRILSIDSTCSYVEAAADRTSIPPDEIVSIHIRVDTVGNLGKIAKTIEILTELSSEPDILTIRGTILHQAFDRNDPQALFTGSCAKCHVGNDVRPKTGQALYDAVCYACHQDKRFPPVRNASELQKIIRSGISGRMMPGFSEQFGGPLSEAQIQSIVLLLMQPPGSH
jgi:hypothetical protein